jgi:hypothetical protein
MYFRLINEFDYVNFFNLWIRSPHELRVMLAPIETKTFASSSCICCC